jgi:rRNA methylases
MDSPSLWLALDEVVDPQNFGALLRSAYFLGGNSMGANSNLDTQSSSIGVLVCSKNSAPPSPVVSAASAGALELCQVHSTSNLPRTLHTAKEDGWRILGAAAMAPSGMLDPQTGEPVQCLNLRDVKTDESQPPTILVLGSEGHGLRTLVAKACTGFIRIPKNQAAFLDSGETSAGVDSLNVSVTGGIMLWHFLNEKNA